MAKGTKDTSLEDAFLERYKNLNKEQKEAVDTIEGPVMVVAGPGTGKTEILTLRIANILRKTDTQPENILALTFTDAASANMRRRLSRLIGASAYRVQIETFHSFCNNVIKDYPEYFPTIIGSGNITEVESVAILEEIITELPLNILKPWGDPLYYIRSAGKKIEELKREAVSPEMFTELVAKEELKFKGRSDLYHEKGAHKGKMKGEHKDFERLLEKNKELAVIYSAYQKELMKRRLYDYSDMIMEVLSALQKSEDLRLSLEENNQYILVDEHQDTNNAQNKILELLGEFHPNPNIFIVGDEKQAIFRFQGASMENFRYFKKLYPSAKIILLSLNYRSGQNILDAAHSLLPGEAPLRSGDKKESSKILISEFTNRSIELHSVAEKISELIEKKKVQPSEIAIIYRSNREAFPMADTLEKKRVAYAIESDEDLLGERYVKKVISVIEAVYHYGEDEYLVPILHMEEFGIDALDAYRLIAESSRKRTFIYDLISDTPNEKIKALSQKLADWVKKSKSDHLSQFLERILRESGILDTMVASRDAEAFLGIERLFDEGKRILSNRPGATIKDFVEYLDIIRKRNLFIKRPKHSIRPDAVRLMTAHRSKGLEFEHVFIINATERSFGEKADRDSLRLINNVYSLDTNVVEEEGQNINDERRLFYVAITRAKEEVHITYSNSDENGKEILASPFILEIREDMKELVPTDDYERKIKESPDLLYSERVPTGVREIDKEFVSELFHTHSLSVTALNNYLSCPWKYFYRNLLRIPSVPEKHQIYGIAMHAAVEDMWRTAKERDIDKQFLLDSYKRNLGLQGILNQSEYKEALLRGEKALSGWFEWSNPKLTNPVISEFSVGGVEVFPGVIISGKIDLAEVVGERRFVVTDYKTGKPKTRNEIEGKTKTSTGDIKRQLLFYKLLLSLHDGIDMETGVIEFLEPGENGKYVREEFQMADEGLDDIKETIKRVSDEVISLKFWNSTCTEKDCEYCGYRKLIQNN